MKNSILLFLLSLFVSELLAQDTPQPPKQHKTIHYRTTSYEFIFSFANVKGVSGNQYNSGLRFSGFYNEQAQYHFDFSKGIGIYTGLGIRNVGMITYPATGVELKQRVYGLGVPLALKLGNMWHRTYLSLGGEAEYFFNYKIKYFIGGHKTKFNKWFPDQVNAFNPSVFVELQSKSGLFIRGKYYLMDFLKPQNSLALPDGTLIPGYSQSSKLFYVSFGFNIKAFKKMKLYPDVDIRPQ